ncbi:MAG: hypothetical protein COA49_02810 [Bacteroidetes bacterium]|nr:MAG: hypothetical protein COA49_02810 [Bacteroidota bacterium]
MNFFKSTLLLLIPGLISPVFLAQNIITLDNHFEDWVGAQTWTSNTGGNINEVSVAHTNEWVYFYIKTTNEVALDETTLPNSIQLVIDFDNNPGTGSNYQGLGLGAEMVINFPTRAVTLFNSSGGSSGPGINDVGVHVSPVYSATQFEIAIDRSLVNLGDGVMNFVWYESSSGSEIPSGGGTHTLTSFNPAITPTAIEKAPGTEIRVAFWNVNRRLDEPVAQLSAERILSATQPDVIGFSEVDDVTAAFVTGLLNSWMPLPGGTSWNVVKDDYDLMIASRFPIASTYPAISRQLPGIISTEAVWGVPMLFTSSHLKCCNGDVLRQQQADEYMAFQRDAMTSGGSIDIPVGSPIVYGGDLNMVGLGGPIYTLESGNIFDNGQYGADFQPDWDGTPMLQLDARQTDRLMDYTWRSDWSSYMPGKLDYILISDGVIDVLNQFTLQTSDLSPARLSQYGLLAGDDLAASDHFIVVADLALTGGTSQQDSDGDGINDSIDNCPDLANADQNDFNADGIGDACSDFDNDGLSDELEIQVLGTDPSIQDTDGDGLTDGIEVSLFITDPLLYDTDGNGFSDAEDLLFAGTSTCAGDANGDGTVTVSDLLVILSTFGNIC